MSKHYRQFLLGKEALAANFSYPSSAAAVVSGVYLSALSP
jgi:hypothetical protein